MALVDLITEKIVKVPLESRDKPGVLRELVQILKDAGEIDDFDKVLLAINKREEMGSTGLEFGIAVPHARTDSVKNLTVALGISPGGTEFNALDGKPSHLFFLLLAPPDKSAQHIEALAEIAKLARSRSFCLQLMQANSAQQVVELFREE